MDIEVTLQDVIDAGGDFPAALRAVIEDRDDVMLADSSAMDGHTFATSGPGIGWTRNFDCNDYAQAALDMGFLAIDSDDGRITDVSDDWEWDNTSDDWEWSPESVVWITWELDHYFSDLALLEKTLRSIKEHCCGVHHLGNEIIDAIHDLDD